MTRSEFKNYSERWKKTIAKCYFGMLMLLMGIALAISLPLSPKNRPALKQQMDLFYQQHPGIPHGAIPLLLGLLFLGVMVSIPLVFYFLANRFWGVHCPGCRRNVIYRGKTEAILKSGECPFCHEQLFKEEAVRDSKNVLPE